MTTKFSTNLTLLQQLGPKLDLVREVMEKFVIRRFKADHRKREILERS
jgi:hypothetical protein